MKTTSAHNLSTTITEFSVGHDSLVANDSSGLPLFIVRDMNALEMLELASSLLKVATKRLEKGMEW